MVATMLVDADHLIATPIYDPARCSIGFHPFHTPLAIALYTALAATPLVPGRWKSAVRARKALNALHLVGLGLLIHMALDWADCRIAP